MNSKNDFVTSSEVEDRTAFGGSDDITIPPRLRIGETLLDRYKVKGYLGEGAMGVVYHCFDTMGEIDVAIKMLPEKLSGNKEIMEEIRYNYGVTEKLKHENIVGLKNLEPDPRHDGSYLLVMELVKGKSLHEEMLAVKKSGSKFSLESTVAILRQLAAALDYAHEKKVVHRDIKSGNIMIANDGRVTILDFGLAAKIKSTLASMTGWIDPTSGTPAYKSPEQWRGRPSQAASDQYALGVLAYEMLAGHLPFEGDDTGILRLAVLNDAPQKIDGIPESAWKAIARALAKDPEERFESCAAFAESLGEKKPQSAAPSGKGFSKGLAALLALLLFCAGLGTWYYFDRQQPISGVVVPPGYKPAPEPAKPQPEQPKPQPEQPKPQPGQPKPQPEQPKPQPEQPKPQPEQPKPESDQNREREITQKVQQTYRLQAGMLSKKRDIESANYDPGQGFGKYLRELKENYEAGELALNNNDITAANTSFAMADQAADWLIRNAPLRKEVQTLQADVRTQKVRAERFNASRLSYALYRSALAKETQAKKDYDAGNFPPAFTALKNALEEYRKAYTESRDLTLSNLIKSAERAKSNRQWEQVKNIARAISSLDSAKAQKLIQYADAQIRLEKLNKKLASARSAKSEKNWQSVHDHAVAALNIDSNNTEARSLKQEAENNLIPTLEIISYVNGKQVSATVRSLKTLPAWNNRPWKLEKGKEYEFSVTYKSGNDEYAGKIPAFTCTGYGLLRKKVTLEKVFNGTVTLSNGVQVEMVKVAPGSFIMSKRDGENLHTEVEHRKTLTKPFYIGKYEVTQAQWRTIMGNDPSCFKGDNRPVEQVTWHEAMNFCERMNQYAPTGWKFTLPTETQWEFAARGGNQSRGYKYSGSNNLGEVGWHFLYFENFTHEVGRKFPNELGIHDMSGNVWEWCLDNAEWQSNNTRAEFSRSYSDSDCLNRVIRGGSWSNFAMYCRSASRNGYIPVFRSSNLGFRLALVPVQ